MIKGCKNNKFIENITFIKHEKNHTVLKITFKSFGFPLIKELKPDQKITYVIIDKRITRDIKLYTISDYGNFDANFDAKFYWEFQFY